MGNIIAKKCKSCGFSNEFRYGGGRYSYLTHCPVPAINKETGYTNKKYRSIRNFNKKYF